jgi:hypothetical protein
MVTGWKWDDIAEGVDALVRAKKQELVDALNTRAIGEDSLSQSVNSAQDAAYHKGRASAFREVRDAVKPK